MPILNYTTKIDAYKTITEIQQILAKHGATKIVVDNNADRLPTGLTFCISFREQIIAFALPCNFEGVLRSMNKNKKVPRHMCNKEQALRVGWRILKVWIEAQLAIVEAEVAALAEVFLPYAVTKTGQTMYNYLQNDSTLLLGN